MVSQMSMVFMVVTLLLSIGVPITFLVYLRRKGRISWTAILIGMVIFVVFSRILEQLLHLYVLKINPHTAAWMKNPYAYAIYGALAAGLFEEVGRFIGLKYLLRKYREWKDGVAYGVGHGGAEALLIGALGSINSLVLANLINSGQLSHLMSVNGNAAASLEAVQAHLVATPPYLFALGGVERVMAFLLQVGLSLLVLYAVRNRKWIFLVGAIFIHAFVDFFAALAQAGKHTLVAEEVILFVVGVMAAIFMVKSKRLFSHSPNQQHA